MRTGAGTGVDGSDLARLGTGGVGQLRAAGIGRDLKLGYHGLRAVWNALEARCEAGRRIDL